MGSFLVAFFFVISCHSQHCIAVKNVQCTICASWVNSEGKDVTLGPYPVCGSCNTMPLKVFIHKNRVAAEEKISQEMSDMEARIMHSITSVEEAFDERMSNIEQRLGVHER